MNPKLRRKNWLVIALVWVVALVVLAVMISWKMFYAAPVIP